MFFLLSVVFCFPVLYDISIHLYVQIVNPFFQKKIKKISEDHLDPLIILLPHNCPTKSRFAFVLWECIYLSTILWPNGRKVRWSPKQSETVRKQWVSVRFRQSSKIMVKSQSEEFLPQICPTGSWSIDYGLTKLWLWFDFGLTFLVKRT